MSEPVTHRYEGLNLPDLMELMHPVVYPEPISYFPATIAWLIIAVWLMAILILVTINRVQKYRADGYRREAVRRIQTISCEEHTAAQEIASLVKRTAIAAYSRGEVASLTGTRWCRFLSDTSEQISESEAALVAEAAYEPDVRVEDVKQVAILWVRSHHA